MPSDSPTEQREGKCFWMIFLWNLSWNIISFRSLDLISTDIFTKKFDSLFRGSKSYLYAIIFNEKVWKTWEKKEGKSGETKKKGEEKREKIASHD